MFQRSIAQLPRFEEAAEGRSTRGSLLSLLASSEPRRAYVWFMFKSRARLLVSYGYTVGLDTTDSRYLLSS